MFFFQKLVSKEMFEFFFVEKWSVSVFFFVRLAALAEAGIEQARKFK
jgi:hypothetical protein